MRRRSLRCRGDHVSTCVVGVVLRQLHEKVGGAGEEGRQRGDERLDRVRLESSVALATTWKRRFVVCSWKKFFRMHLLRTALQDVSGEALLRRRLDSSSQQDQK